LFCRTLVNANNPTDPAAMVACSCYRVFCTLCLVGTNDNSVKVQEALQAGKAPIPLIKDVKGVWVGTVTTEPKASTSSMSNHMAALHTTTEGGALNGRGPPGPTGGAGAGSGPGPGAPGAGSAGAGTTVATPRGRPRADTYQGRRTLTLPSGDHPLPLPDMGSLITQAGGGATIQSAEFDLITRAITLFCVHKHLSVASVLNGMCVAGRNECPCVCGVGGGWGGWFMVVKPLALMSSRPPPPLCLPCLWASDDTFKLLCWALNPYYVVPGGAFVKDSIVPSMVACRS
jgi:hypothetical protein